jgi:hypothetical protein
LHANHLNTTKTFIATTIFFSESIVIKKVLEFIKNNNYRGYFLNNMYDDNTVNFDNSPIHFIERLFGLINIR